MEENNKQNSKLISDEEMATFKANFGLKLENEISETEIGKKILFFQKFKIGISMDRTIEEYIEENGHTMDSNGLLVLDEESLNSIFKQQVLEANKLLGFDVLLMENEAELERMIVNPDYREEMLSSVDFTDGMNIYDSIDNKFEGLDQIDLTINNIIELFNDKEKFMDIVLNSNDIDDYFKEKIQKDMELFASPQELIESYRKEEEKNREVLEQIDNIYERYFGDLERTEENARFEVNKLVKINTADEGRMWLLMNQLAEKINSGQTLTDEEKNSIHQYRHTKYFDLITKKDVNGQAISPEQKELSEDSLTNLIYILNSNRAKYDIDVIASKFDPSEFNIKNGKDVERVLNMLAVMGTMEKHLIQPADKKIWKNILQEVSKIYYTENKKIPEFLKEDGEIDQEAICEFLEKEANRIPNARKFKTAKERADAFLFIKDKIHLVIKKLDEKGPQYDTAATFKDQVAGHLKDSIEDDEKIVSALTVSLTKNIFTIDKSNKAVDDVAVYKSLTVLETYFDAMSYEKEVGIPQSNLRVDTYKRRMELFNRIEVNIPSKEAFLKKVIIANIESLDKDLKNYIDKDGKIIDPKFFEVFDKVKRENGIVFDNTLSERLIENENKLRHKIDKDMSNATYESSLKRLKMANRFIESDKPEKVFKTLEEVSFELFDENIINYLQKADPEKFNERYGKEYKALQNKKELGDTKTGTFLLKSMRTIIRIKDLMPLMDDKELRDYYGAKFGNKVFGKAYRGLLKLGHKKYEGKEPFIVRKLSNDAKSLLQDDEKYRKDRNLLKQMKQRKSRGQKKFIGVDGQEVDINKENKDKLKFKIKNDLKHRNNRRYRRNIEYKTMRKNEKLDEKIYSLQEKVVEIRKEHDNGDTNISMDCMAEIRKLSAKKQKNNELLDVINGVSKVYAPYKDIIKEYKRNKLREKFGLKPKQKALESGSKENKQENKVVKNAEKGTTQVDKSKEKDQEEKDLKEKEGLDYLIVDNANSQIEKNAMKKMEEQKEQSENQELKEQKNVESKENTSEGQR